MFNNQFWWETFKEWWNWDYYCIKQIYWSAYQLWAILSGCTTSTRERKLANQQSNCFISVCVEKGRETGGCSSLCLQCKVNVNMRFNSPSRVCLQVCCYCSGASRTLNCALCRRCFIFLSHTHTHTHIHTHTHASEYQYKQPFTITTQWKNYIFSTFSLLP